ncbi:MAG: radical SAM protein [Eubacteriales bacterium]|nr:radical SAM protein [Eubacteriales bacterium]
MSNLRENIELKLVSKAVDHTLDVLRKDDPRPSLRKLLHTFWRFTGDTYQESSYDSLRAAIDDPQNDRWVRLLQRGARDIDPHILHSNFMNFGYWGSAHGIQKNNRLSEENACNIPNIILFDPTTACNMQCKGCWSAEYGHKWNMSYETMQKIVREGIEVGCYIYFMTGGEPLVRKQEILKLAEEFPQAAFHIYTNATLIDEAFCEEVKRLGNLSFAVSIEGFEDMNDSRRGEGSYQRIIESLKLMKKHKLGYAASICYTSANYRLVTSDEFLRFLIDLGVVHVWYFHYMPVGVKAAPELMPTADQRAYMIKRIRYLRSPACDLDIFVADFQNDGEFVGGCIAGGRNYIHINAKGDIEPCVFIHYSNSNINDTSLMEAMKAPLMMAYHDNQPFNDNHFRPCPMLENPEILPRLVKESGAISTDYVAPEKPEDLAAKSAPYAAQWADRAHDLWEEFGKGQNIAQRPDYADLVEEQKQQQAELHDQLVQLNLHP